MVQIACRERPLKSIKALRNLSVCSRLVGILIPDGLIFERRDMTEIHYKIVEHDGGWAYRVGDVFSETFPSHDAAAAAARTAAQEQSVRGSTAAIQYQDQDGRWLTEIARGDDRPLADVED